jgi:dethiobiotin synthetase
MKIIIAATDTNVGKTLLSAMILSSRDEYRYWKPIQSGTIDETDSETVKRISECSDERIIPEAYIFSEPLSPHLASRLDGINIDTARLQPPDEPNVVIELAGGVLVPVTDTLLQADLIARWNIPVVLATRSSLGTINHTLLTVEALRKRQISIAGCVMIGDPNPENERAVTLFGAVTMIGRIPIIRKITKRSLQNIYNDECTKLDQLLSR